MSTWINFDELRKRLVSNDVLRLYEIELTPKGNSDQSIGFCPLPNHGDGRTKSFSLNVPKGLWQCFGCKESGNLLDLAVLMEGKDKKIGRDVRQVALKLQREFFGEPSPRPPKDAPRRNDAPRPAPPKRDEPTSPAKPTVVNAPLDFSLKTLQADHPYFEANNLTPATVERFGLGFCSRGSLAGRIAVPLLDDAEQLVGYGGLAADEDAASPRYLFPANREVEGTVHVFDKGMFLYNGFRIGRSAKDLIVVAECGAVWSLWQGGFANVVGLMGDECSDDQAALITLLSPEGGRVWLLTDKTASGEACAQSFLLKVASSRLCRWVRVPERKDIAPDHPLLALLPKR